MNYSKEFKDEALKLSDEIGTKKACEQLGIKYYTLSEWRKNRKARLSEPINHLTDAQAKALIQPDRRFMHGFTYSGSRKNLDKCSRRIEVISLN